MNLFLPWHEMRKHNQVLCQTFRGREQTGHLLHFSDILKHDFSFPRECQTVVGLQCHIIFLSCLRDTLKSNFINNFFFFFCHSTREKYADRRSLQYLLSIKHFGKSEMTVKPTALSNPWCWELIRNLVLLKNKWVFNKWDLRMTYKLWIMGLCRGGFWFIGKSTGGNRC